jgi:transcriptional regulator with XRE-family HTH domain
MSYIGKNIRKIRTVKKISQADFAELFGLGRPSVGAYEEGRAEPKLDTIIKMAQHFGLSIDVLLTKELTVNELYKFDIFHKDKLDLQKEGNTASLDKDDNQADTPLVRKEAFLEYIVNYQNKDFINTLPSINLPDAVYKKTRAFEMPDQAMEFNEKGLLPGDILSCAPADPESLKKLRIDAVYVIVTRKDILVRRLAAKRSTLDFKADNVSYELLSFSPVDLLELWKVEGFYSTSLTPPALLEERVALLEKQVKKLYAQTRG